MAEDTAEVLVPGRVSHFSRSFGPDRFAPRCGCKVAACGLVIETEMNPECDQHPFHNGKTIRSAHSEDNCPGPQPNAAPQSPDGRGDG